MSKKGYKQSPNSRRILSVPNTDEGRLFLTLFSKYANHARYRFKKIGRGPAKCSAGGCQLSKAYWIAVNAYRKGTYDIQTSLPST